MKIYVNALVALLAVTAADFSIVDSDGDRTKSVIFIHYSDGTDDRLVVAKDKLDSPATREAVERLIQAKR